MRPAALKVDTAQALVEVLADGVVERRKSLRPTAYAIRDAQQQISRESGKRQESRGNWTLPQIPESKRHVIIRDALKVAW